MVNSPHRSDAIRGALWLVDNEPDMDISRDEQNSRISRYLSCHAHYCYFGHIYKPEHLKAMTVKRFRVVMTGIAANVKVRDDHMHTVDLLWKVKSHGLREDFLKKYKYDRATFIETELPGPSSATMSDNLVLRSEIPITINRRMTRSGASCEMVLSTWTPDNEREMPLRRSQLFVILDVEKSLAVSSTRYFEQSTRLRALHLLIKQYKLTYWDCSTDNVVELKPQQLIKSLQKSSSISRAIAIKDFWQLGCQSERERLRNSLPDMGWYDAVQGLPTYGTFPFPDSNEDIKLALLEMGIVGVEDEAALKEPAVPVLEVIPDLTELSTPKLSVCHNSLAQLIVIEDIDNSKLDCGRRNYKYGTRPRRRRALNMIIKRHLLQRWDKSKLAFVDLHGKTLHKMLTGLFKSRSSERKEIGVMEIWSKGSSAFGNQTMEWLRDCAKRLSEYSNMHHTSEGLVARNSETAGDQSGRHIIRDEAFRVRKRYSIIAASQSPPRKHLRKRKAKEADLPSRPTSSASNNMYDSDFVPSPPHSSSEIQEEEPPRFLALDRIKHLSTNVHKHQQSTVIKAQARSMS